MEMYRTAQDTRMKMPMMMDEKGPSSKCPVEHVTGGQFTDPQVTMQSGQPPLRDPITNQQAMAPTPNETR